MTINLLTALLLALAGFTLGLRQIFLDPRNATFPCAPAGVRMLMFLGAGALGGLAVLFWGHSSRPYAGEAAAPIAVLAGLLAIYFSAMVINVLAQRWPSRVWDRINAYDARVRASSRADGPLRQVRGRR